MILSLTLGALAVLSLVLLLWQWLVALRFPLHRRGQSTHSPAVTLLKPLKGCDDTTEACLRSWFTQDYSGPVQILFAVASAADPVCALVERLRREFPGTDAELVLCGPLAGANLKVSQLAQAEPKIRHDCVVLSDADVKAPRELLANLLAPLAAEEVGLVNCFYTLANPSNTAMQWEAVAINADFWSQVLQARSLKPLDFALGAAMAMPRAMLQKIGGFASLADCLADDYQLGNRIAAHGKQIALCPVVVECWSAPMTFSEVWKHQLRWARTIRVCQPAPYFFSILSNGTLWPLLWVLFCPSNLTVAFFGAACLLRILTARHLQRRLVRGQAVVAPLALPLAKDLLQTLVWALAFLGSRVEWRGEVMRLRRDGSLVRA